MAACLLLGAELNTFEFMRAAEAGETSFMLPKHWTKGNVDLGMPLDKKQDD